MKKIMKIEKDLNEARRVYDLTKDVQLFDDMEVTPMSFEEFCAKSTAGDIITFVREETTVPRKAHKAHNKHKEHKTHSHKGKCLEGYTVVDNTVYIPKGIKVSTAIRTYCSRNGIKIVR